MGALVQMYSNIYSRLGAARKTASEIFNHSRYYDYVKVKVFEIFSKIKPLSYKTSTVAVIDSYELVVGSWIRIKRPYHKYGSPVNYSEEFYRLIVGFGDKIAEHVMKSKRELFRSLVDLARKTVPYSKCCVERKIDAKIPFPGDLPDIVLRRAVKIRVCSDSPLNVNILFEGEDDESIIFIDTVQATIVLEDIADIVNEMYVELYNKFVETKRRNEKIINEMRKLITAYTIVFER